jgi:hypothetical protein
MDLRNGSEQGSSAASRGRLQHYSVIIRGGGVSICVLTGKPEKWLHYRVVNQRQHKQTSQQKALCPLLGHKRKRI